MISFKTQIPVGEDLFPLHRLGTYHASTRLCGYAPIPAAALALTALSMRLIAQGTVSWGQQWEKPNFWAFDFISEGG